LSQYEGKHENFQEKMEEAMLRVIAGLTSKGSVFTFLGLILTY
jgi:hypothetical protein